MLTYTEKNSKRQKLEDILPLKIPLGLCIEPTSICNFKCTQCPVSLPAFKEIVGGTGHIDMDLYRKILFDVKAMGKLQNLNLYGDGEPLLNKNIADMVRLAREMDVAKNITVTTNAALLTEEMAEKLIHSGLTYLRVSVYSIYQERFRKVTKSGISVDTIFNNVKKFKRRRDSLHMATPFLYVKMIDTYSQETEEFKKKYAEVADQVNIETPMNWNGFNGIDLISQVDPDRLTDETLIQGFYEERNKSGLKRVCTTPFHSLNIKRNGDVVICIVDWNKGTKIGDITRQSLSEIWFGDDLMKFRDMHIHDRRQDNASCKNCKYLYCNPDNIDHLTEEQYQKILNYKG